MSSLPPQHLKRSTCLAPVDFSSGRSPHYTQSLAWCQVSRREGVLRQDCFLIMTLTKLVFRKKTRHCFFSWMWYLWYETRSTVRFISRQIILARLHFGSDRNESPCGLRTPIGVASNPIRTNTPPTDRSGIVRSISTGIVYAVPFVPDYCCCISISGILMLTYLGYKSQVRLKFCSLIPNPKIIRSDSLITFGRRIGFDLAK